MIEYKAMQPEQAARLAEIDRSEVISLIYATEEGRLTATTVNYECPTWDEAALKILQARFIQVLEQGGAAIGAFSGTMLAGFGVLGHEWRGADHDQLQVDLLYVSRPFRRQGIGSRIMELLAGEARQRGARYLYVSATETGSAVNFYQSRGSYIAQLPDPELLALEPKDIHLLIAL